MPWLGTPGCRGPTHWHELSWVRETCPVPGEDTGLSRSGPGCLSGPFLAVVWVAVHRGVVGAGHAALTLASTPLPALTLSWGLHPRLLLPSAGRGWMAGVPSELALLQKCRRGRSDGRLRRELPAPQSAGGRRWQGFMTPLLRSPAALGLLEGRLEGGAAPGPGSRAEPLVEGQGEEQSTSQSERDHPFSGSGLGSSSGLKGARP